MTRAMGLVAVLLVGLAGGVGAARLAWDDGQGGDPADPADPAAAVDVAPVADPPAIRDVVAVDAGPGAPDARTAIEAFLAAERDGRFDDSYRLLSEADRARYRTSDGWRAAHESLAPITGFHVATVEVDRDTATSAVELSLDAGLDEVVGLVPGAADAVVIAVDGGDGWRVAFTEGTLRPRYLDERAAPAAVADWATARQACEQPEQYDGGLVGFPTLGDALCGAAGAVTVGPPAPLAEVDAARFVSAFGPDATVWARVVALEAPVPLRAVVAPVGDRWLVIGLLQ